MNKKEFISEVQENLGETVVSKAIIEEVFDAIFLTLKETIDNEDFLTVNGFGKFSFNQTEPRVGRNPSTGESVDIEAKRQIKFKPSNTLKEYLNS
jgi:nucleoid DNA-binding protein